MEVMVLDTARLHAESQSLPELISVIRENQKILNDRYGRILHVSRSLYHCSHAISQNIDDIYIE